MDNISEAIFQSIDVIVDKKLAQLQYDVTFESDIYSVIDADAGEYRVLYNGDYLSAFARYPSEQYKVGERVQVLVPGNELSGRKTILGRANNQSLVGDSSTTAALSTVEVSPTFDKLYGYDSEATYGVVAGARFNPSSLQDSDRLSYQLIYPFDSSTPYHGTFKNYASQYEYLRIEGTFFTAFQSIHTSGNYGLLLTFLTNDNDTITYRLDLGSFNGDPYSLQTPTPQSIILKIQKGYLVGLNSILLFEENFEYDRYVKDGIISDERNTDTPNIFVKDVKVQYVEIQDYSANSYYLGIAATRGTALSSQVRNITLEGQLIFQGNNIYNSNQCECQWFIQDPAIMVTSADYRKSAGVGWRILSGETSNSLSLALSTSDVWLERTYKLVLTYKNDIVLSAEKTVVNLDSSYSCSILQANDNNGFQLQLRNDSSTEQLLGDWYISYPDGSYLHVTEDRFRDVIAVDDYLYYTSATFYCKVYNSSNQYITTLSYVAITSEFKDDVTLSFSGEEVFRYDANGDITYEDSEKERYLIPQLTWRENVYAAGVKLQWYNVDGKPLEPTIKPVSIDSEQKSMLSDVRVDSAGNLYYHIRQKYKNFYNNNTLTLVVSTIDNTYAFKKEILFIKDGDQGTNGTTYICAIRPQDTSGNKSSEYTPLIYRNNRWMNSVNLRCFVYKDGERVDHSGEGYNYKWTGVGTSEAVGYNASFATSGSGSPASPRYVKCQVTIPGENITIYSLYPLDTVVGDLTVSDIHLEDIPQYVRYTSTGDNALYYNYELNATYGNQALTVTSGTPGLLGVVNNRLSPTGKFTFEENSIGVLVCRYDDGRCIYRPIMMYLDTFGNEAINGWDGTSIETQDGHILAPQIGAGVKDSVTNLFTGVVMGKDTAQKQIGLYGYQSGHCSFGLKADGTAFFGRSDGGGKITLNGQTATIYGGDTTDTTVADNGMRITLANKSVNGTTKAIIIGKNVFTVDYNGKLTATNIDVSGKVTATDGSIGGWTITKNTISNGSFQLNAKPDASSPSITASNGKFYVTSSGILHCSDAVISGEVTATTLNATGSGSIGGWTIGSNKLTGGSTELNSDGTIKFGSWGSIVGNATGYDGKSSTNVIRIASSAGVRLEAATGLAIKAGSSDGIWLEGGPINCQQALYVNQGATVSNGLTVSSGSVDFSSISASNQKGIYARFA